MYIVELFNVQLLLGAGGQINEGGLAGAVAGAVRDVDSTRPRGDVENAATALLPEDGDHKAHEVVWSMEIDS